MTRSGIRLCLPYVLRSRRGRLAASAVIGSIAALALAAPSAAAAASTAVAARARATPSAAVGAPAPHKPKIIASIKAAFVDSVAVSPLTGSVYVPAASGTSILMLSGTTGKVLATIPLGLPAAARYFAGSIVVSPVNGKVYVESTGYHDDMIVTVISGTTGKILATVVTGPEDAGSGLAISP